MQLYVSAYALADIEEMARLGADGLVFACGPYSLRSMHHLAHDEIQAAIARCHACGIQARFLMNAFLYEEDLLLAEEQMKTLIQSGADGIYFADEALLAIAQRIGASDRLIYQPDTLVTNHADVDYYLQEGCQAVVLAKEITLQEIAEIAEHSDPKRIEIIGHGHVVMMHSRRPLLSNYMEFIGSDRDLRGKHDLYLIEETRSDRLPIIEDEAGTHIFSAYVLNSFLQMETLMHTGIHAMRIDGMFQTREQLFMTVRLYDQVRKGSLSGEQAKAMLAKQFAQMPLGEGFYDQATGLTK